MDSTYSNTVTVYGRETDFTSAAMLMDDEIREELHNEMAPCTPQEFMNAYVKAHHAKYGTRFQVN